MVSHLPIKPRPTDDELRRWLLDRLDFIRAMVEAGEDCMIEDGGTVAHDGRRLRTATFVLYDDVWLQHHRARTT